MTRAALLLASLALCHAVRANPCEDAARAAEGAASLPPGLLAAIGRVESGRRAADGHVAPWPWSVNAGGEGYYLGSAAEAIALVRGLQARGIQSIDVGCFQMNLFYHPAAFANLEAAFDPQTNALAAGAFLHDLQAGATEWDGAVARYHSADPARGLPYARQVLASWHGGADMPAPPLSQVAALVRVFVPGGMAPGLVRSAAGRLPVIITPSPSRS